LRLTVDRLFDSGLFSDITFKYGKYHTFNLHAAVINSKSTWFVNHCDTKITPPGNQYHIADDGISDEVLRAFNSIKIQHCSKHEATETCVTSTFLAEMFRFCYVGEYPPASWTQYSVNAMELCISHVYMYYLSKRFGISGLLERCAMSFATALEAVQDDEVMYAFMINLIYDLLGDDESDLLLHEARTHVEKFCGDQIIQSRAIFVAEVKQCKLVKMMPKAGQDLLNRSLSLTAFNLSNIVEHEMEPESSSSKETEAPEAVLTCARCIEPFQADAPTTASEPVSNLCDACKNVKSTSANVRLPVERQRGLTITIWECGGCHLLWNCDGIKNRVDALDQCPCCRLSPDEVAPRKKKEVMMQCTGCNGVWRAYGHAFHTSFELEHCIRCS
jgi:hypothetical protein